MKRLIAGSLKIFANTEMRVDQNVPKKVSISSTESKLSSEEKHRQGFKPLSFIKRYKEYDNFSSSEGGGCGIF